MKSMSRVATGRVVGGQVVFESEPLPEGSQVTVLARDEKSGGVFVDEETEAALVEALAAADRGELVDAEEVYASLPPLPPRK